MSAYIYIKEGRKGILKGRQPQERGEEMKERRGGRRMGEGRQQKTTSDGATNIVQ